jgi:DNA-3-methyladenine glycosylase II
MAKESVLMKDQKLASIMQTIPEPIVVSTRDVFFDLMSCVLEQQIHYRSTKKTFEKMLHRAGLTTLTSQNFGLFEEKAFAGAKFSLSKYETVGAVVDFFSQHNLPWESLSDQEVKKHLSSIKGIGDWTIEMILLYTLERPDVFPVGDYHLKEIMTKVYGLNPNSKLKAQMLTIADQWGGQKSKAVKYLLAWKEYQKIR